MKSDFTVIGRYKYRVGFRKYTDELGFYRSKTGSRLWYYRDALEKAEHRLTFESVLEFLQAWNSK